MSVVATRPALSIGETEPPRRRWTRDEYHAIAKLGILDDCRYELIEGDIVAKMGQDRKHGVAVMRCTKWLSRIFAIEYVQVQIPVSADRTNEPEPDVAVFREPWEAYSDSPPTAESALFVEVTNTTQTQDRRVKRRVYARNNVPEYWILDVTERTLTVLRAPLAGDYASETTLNETELVTPFAAPPGTAPIRVADLLPPATGAGDQSSAVS